MIKELLKDKNKVVFICDGTTIAQELIDTLVNNNILFNKGVSSDLMFNTYIRRFYGEANYETDRYFILLDKQGTDSFYMYSRPDKHYNKYNDWDTYTFIDYKSIKRNKLLDELMYE